MEGADSRPDSFFIPLLSPVLLLLFSSPLHRLHVPDRFFTTNAYSYTKPLQNESRPSLPSTSQPGKRSNHLPRDRLQKKKKGKDGGDGAAPLKQATIRAWPTPQLVGSAISHPHCQTARSTKKKHEQLAPLLGHAREPCRIKYRGGIHLLTALILGMENLVEGGSMPCQLRRPLASVA